MIAAVKCLKVSCSVGESFFDIWSNVLYDYHYDNKHVPELFKGATSPYAVYRVLESLDPSILHLIVFDEFDRIRNPDTTTIMADLIKHFSNNPANITILIVGVGDTLIDLFESHELIARCCAQIKMQRMSEEEMSAIINERIPKLHMKIDERTKSDVIKLSQGLPGYAHLLGLLSARAAIDEEKLEIGEVHLMQALSETLDKAGFSTRQDYYKAIQSPARDNKYKEVLLACALAETNELGMFFAGNVREPYSRIRDKEMDVAHFATHLNEFCSEDRGPALIKSGKRKNYQYRFANPLLQSLVLMVGARDGLFKI